jgi:dipeptidyl aminopeptidase/acylaminoacyl peptidase
MKNDPSADLHQYSMWFILLALLLMWGGCGRSGVPGDAQVIRLDRVPVIFPDYTGITVPVNIAPLNFEMREEGEKFYAMLEGENGTVLKRKSRESQFRIPARRWAGFLMENQGSQVAVKVFSKEGNLWTSYKPFVINVAAESIDPYLVYRLIPPGYETWSSMGLYERDLTSFRETAVIENRNIEDNCVNCHSFSNGSSENMLFHIRGSVGGTVIKHGDDIEKVDLKREEMLSGGVYPSWHPSGDYIAFSTNRIEQYFHAHTEMTIEVLDRQSDLILYHVDSKEITHVPGTEGDVYMETYPSWSPDGKILYFSRTNADMTTPFDSIRYDIYRIAFHPEQGTFGETEPVLLASQQAKSASFPRISPDGRYLLCTLHDYGTFPIWHKEADLCLVDLSTGRSDSPANVNSGDTDSYHTWGQNSRWIVFSSRRYDGRYTKLYISYMNKEGQFQKAFLLPQRDPGMYDSFFYSYNRPELITGPIQTRSRKWVRVARDK